MARTVTYELGAVGAFDWLRVDARTTARCRRCETGFDATVPVLVEWLDRQSVSQQEEISMGLACPRCGALTPLDLPLLQYRAGDAVGLVIGFPAESDTDDDRRVIQDVLSVAQSDGGPERIDGADTVVAVRMSWWADVCRRPLGPVLVGAEQLSVPETDEEVRRWLADTVDALGLPDVAALLADYLEADDVDDAVQLVRDDPVLVSPRWQLAVRSLARTVRDHLREGDAEVVDGRIAMLPMLAQIGPADYRPSDFAGPLAGFARAAHTADRDDRPRLADELVAALDRSAPTPFVSALYTSATFILLNLESRSPARQDALMRVARKAVDVALDVHGPGTAAHWAACLNLAVAIEEQPFGSGSALTDATQILDSIAAPAARAGHPIVADVAANYVSLSTMRTGRRGDDSEESQRLAADARHLTRLLKPGDRHSRLASMVDEAATLRAHLSGNRVDNARRAVELLERAQAEHETDPILTTAEQVLVATNLANALYQLWELNPEQVDDGDLVDACDSTVELAGLLHRLSQVAIDALANCGTVMTQLYVGSAMAGAEDPELWTRARDLLEDAYERSCERHVPGAAPRLRVTVNLAAVYGTSANGESAADADRSAELMEEVTSSDPDPVSDFTLAAATNLGQLRVGQGRWSDAADAYEVARTAQVAQIRRARTTTSRLAEIVKTSDLASRRALALGSANRWDEVPAALEEARGRLVTKGDSTERDRQFAEPPDGTAVAHLATCDYGSVGRVRLPDGATFGFTSPLSAGALKPLINDLVTADGRSKRVAAFDRLAEALTELVDTVATILRASIQPVHTLRVVTGGPLSACPLHGIGDLAGRPLTADWSIVYATTGVPARTDPWRPPDQVVAIVDPSDSLPFARTELEAIERFGQVLVPPAGWSKRSWLVSELPDTEMLHLACHAVADLDDPMRSRFHLADDEELTVADLAALITPQLDLVVASACQAATSNPSAPDELLGVAHALLYAGARTVVSSLWDAPDRSTALLVASFYRELVEVRSPAVALTNAQRYVQTVTGPDLTVLCDQRLADDETARWLPHDLALELRALAAHPRFANGTMPCFGHPVDWAHLSCTSR